MHEKNTLLCYQALKHNLPFDDRRIQLLAALLVALFQLKTVNLARLANILDLRSQPDSKHKRLKRFVADYSIDWAVWAKLIVKILVPEAGFVLAIDRTLWRYGKSWTNVLTLAIVVGNTSVPLFWAVLSHRGNSSLADKTELIDRYIAAFGAESVRYLSGDREFDGIELVKYLNRVKMKFRLRIRSCQPITDKHGRSMRANKLLRTLALGKSSRLRRRRLYGGTVPVFIAVEKGLDSESSVIVISSCAETNILLDYKERWAIETLFENLKSRGFELEETHLTKVERVGKLFGVLALATAWAIKTGEIEAAKNPIKLKKHGRREKSIFRVGCDIIQAILFELGSTSVINIWLTLKC